MSRLTMRLHDGKIGCLSEYTMKDLANKLADYEDKEEQGLLIELPCKVGDTLYINDFRCYWQKEYDRPYEVVVIRIVINAFRVYIDVLLEDGMQYQFNLSDIGKIIFLTRSEAEEALAKMGGK